MDFLEEDIEKCRIYNEFYAKHIELFKSDLIEYWRLCRRYYERVKNNEKEIRMLVRKEDYIENL